MPGPARPGPQSPRTARHFCQLPPVSYGARSQWVQFNRGFITFRARHGRKGGTLPRAQRGAKEGRAEVLVPGSCPAASRGGVSASSRCFASFVLLWDLQDGLKG